MNNYWHWSNPSEKRRCKARSMNDKNYLSTIKSIFQRLLTLQLYWHSKNLIPSLILAHMKVKISSLVAFLLLGSLITYAQTITGKVTDANTGTALQSVNVLEKGTMNGIAF